MTNPAEDYLFQEAVVCEEQGKVADAIRLYKALVSEQPNHAKARVNLGTLLYNKRDFQTARLQYEAAIQASPCYALAHFDLANVLEELEDITGAIRSYETAVQLRYADAHYNLARLLEKIGSPRKAIAHWLAYIKSDWSGPWHDNAKESFKALLAADPLKVVSSNPRARWGKLR